MLPIMHVFVRMATKSMCIFLPPLAVSERAMGVVIIPLNTLQQVKNMMLVNNVYGFLGSR